MFRNLSLIIFILLLLPLPARAAVMFLEPVRGEYRQGDTFMVKVRIKTDADSECVNAVQGNIKFSRDALEAVDFSQGNSIISLWVKTPEIDNNAGFISFAGGIPGGYCGALTGDPGESNLLGRIAFRAELETSGAGIEFLDTSQALLNDGLGTSAQLKTEGLTVKISGSAAELLPRDEWLLELKSDKLPPEPFKIEISREPSVFEGRYFITFQSDDKQAGIDYYEVKEGRRDWQRAVSPYLLQDQEIKGIVKVRAVDKAGNARIAEYQPAKIKSFPWWLALLFIAAGFLWWLIRKLLISKP